MHYTKLKLNPDKTEFLLVGSKLQRDKVKDLFPINLFGNDTTPSSHVKNLGVVFDADHSFVKHISSIYGSCYYHMRDLRRIRRYLTRDAAVSLANALVSSRLDYCNSLLYGVPKKYIDRLQKVQNCLCRIVTRAPHFGHVSHKLKELHSPISRSLGGAPKRDRKRGDRCKQTHAADTRLKSADQRRDQRGPKVSQVLLFGFDDGGQLTSEVLFCNNQYINRTCLPGCLPVC